MAKFTDAQVVTLKGYFDAGDQPTEAQFDALIDAIQQGLEEHDHAGTGDGDGVNNLVGPVGIGGAPAYPFDVQAGAADASRFQTNFIGSFANILIENIENAKVFSLRVTGSASGLGVDSFIIYDDTNAAARLVINQVGAVKINNLAGVGQRDVRVNADGTLVAV